MLTNWCVVTSISGDSWMGNCSICSIGTDTVVGNSSITIRWDDLSDWGNNLESLKVSESFDAKFEQRFLPWQRLLLCGRRRWIHWHHQLCSRQCVWFHQLQWMSIGRWQHLLVLIRIVICYLRWRHRWLNRCMSNGGWHRTQQSWRELEQLIRMVWRRLVILRQQRPKRTMRRTKRRFFLRIQLRILFCSFCKLTLNILIVFVVGWFDLLWRRLIWELNDLTNCSLVFIQFSNLISLKLFLHPKENCVRTFYNLVRS